MLVWRSHTQRVGLRQKERPLTLGRKMLRSAKIEKARTTDAVCFVVVYNKPGRLVLSRLRSPRGMKGLVLGLVVLVL